MVVRTVLASAIVDTTANTIGTTTFILVIGDGDVDDGVEFIVFVEHNIIDDAFDDDDDAFDDDAFDDDDDSLKLEDLRVPLLLDYCIIGGFHE